MDIDSDATDRDSAAASGHRIVLSDESIGRTGIKAARVVWDWEKEGD